MMLKPKVEDQVNNSTVINPFSFVSTRYKQNKKWHQSCVNLLLLQLINANYHANFNINMQINICDF